MALYQLHDLAGNINIKAESLTVLGVPITPGGVGPAGPPGPAGPVGPAGPTNALTLQGASWAAPLSIGAITPAGGAFTSLSCSLLNATAALSTLKVTDLNADLLDGNDWRAPGPIGAVTPAPITATTLSTSTLNVTVSSALAATTTTTLMATGLTTLAATSATILTATTLGVSGLSTLGATTTTTLMATGLATLAATSATILTATTLGVSGLSTLGATTTTTLSSSGLATLASARVTGLAPSSVVMTDASSNLTTGSVAPTEVHVTFFQDAATIVTGNATSFNIAASVWYSMLYYQFPPAINDSFSQRFVMAPGSYLLYCEGMLFTNRGISSWYIDGVLQGTLDWYNGVALNFILGLAVTVVGTGVHTLRCITSSKNGLSTDYYMTINKYWIK